jgi:hypothetical protein
MALNRPVKDEDIVAGFTSLHQAMIEGFDRMEQRFAAVDRRFETVERQILGVRNDVTRLETRMLRRFDDVDARVDKNEPRGTRLEERIA